MKNKVNELLMDFLQFKKQNQFINICDFLDHIEDLKLKTLLDKIDFFYYSDATEDKKEEVLQEFVIIYTMLYVSETGESKIKIDDSFQWLIRLSIFVSLEKFKRLGLVEIYNGFLSNEENIEIKFSEESEGFKEYFEKFTSSL